MARTVYEAAAAADVGAVILELARSEQTYTFQRPIDYATSVLAGAIAAGWRGPVFIQGDHYQFNAKKYAADPEAMTEEIRRACRLAIDAGYRNIDIDSSTLVDLSKPNVDEEQRENYRRAAELTALIRTLETDGVTVSVGGEIGEVGTQNSTVAELRAYLDGYRRELDARAPGATGISKVSVQTGTSHGGVPLPDGGVAEVKLDFEVLRELGVVAREYGLAGAVQHGASTLPDELFHRFPAVETAEIHLATGFQNALYEHPAFPASLHREIEAWCFANAADERKAGQTDQQFVYTTRKKAIGPFKRQLWDLDDEGRDPRRAAAQDLVPLHRARRQRLARRWSTATSSRSSATGRSPTRCARPSPRADRPRVATDAAGSREPSLTAPSAVLSSPRRSGAGPEGSRRGSCPASRVPASCQLQRTARTLTGAVGGGDLVAGPGNSPQDVAARDDAHLRSLGIKPELKRTSGSCRTSRSRSATSACRPARSRTTAVGIGVGGRAFFWSWPLVILGQTFVALNFAELSSHFPVAGSIYQWSKRLSQPDARLVHRLVLLLGRRRDRDRRRGHRAARAVDASIGTIELVGIHRRSPALDMHVVPRR